jgi:hypothetical protein
MDEKTDRPLAPQATRRPARIPPSDQMYVLALARSQRIIAGTVTRQSSAPEPRPRPTSPPEKP